MLGASRCNLDVIFTKRGGGSAEESGGIKKSSVKAKRALFFEGLSHDSDRTLNGGAIKPNPSCQQRFFSF